jgi:xylan 1,4-beta-xylosidase
MSCSFEADFQASAAPFPHFWEHTVGSGHATLALRADWQRQMKRAHEELGMKHVRFHGLLCDDMGTLITQNDERLYSFFNADQICDFLLSIGMKPFVELSFMPLALSSGAQTVFHYRANVTSPKDYSKWGTLIHDLAAHWVCRYGIKEVSQWPFEVWNEPNLTAFGSGKQEDYFELYRHSAQAIKSVDRSLRVGGPATADNAWVADFLTACEAKAMPVDFVTTHHYPTDAFGLPGDDTETQLAKSTRSALRAEAQEVRRQAGDLPLYYTEWSTSSNPRDPMHDEPYAAAFIVKTVMEARGLVQGYSYWTFSDIFEENYFPSVPFHGGFGLLNLHGIAKSSYRAFQLLHQLDAELIETHGCHLTVDAWCVRGVGEITVLLSNFALPRHAITNESVEVTVNGIPRGPRATIQRIDSNHGNPKRRWEQMGKPDYLSESMVAELDAASRLTTEQQPLSYGDRRLRFEVSLPPQSVASIRIEI